MAGDSFNTSHQRYFQISMCCQILEPNSSFIYREISIQPMCGLLLREPTYVLEPDGNSRTTYLATESISFRTDKHSTVSSGFHAGYLRDTSFEFGPLLEGQFFTVAKGLILASHKDGTYHVFNPFTKQVLHLPKSPIVEWGGVSDRQERCAFLINPCPFPDFACFKILVIRVIPRAQLAEVFSAKTCRWVCYELMTSADDDEKDQGLAVRVKIEYLQFMVGSFHDDG